MMVVVSQILFVDFRERERETRENLWNPLGLGVWSLSERRVSTTLLASSSHPEMPD